MAEFHLHGQIIKRSEGRSAVNAAAYRAGEALHDKRLDRTFDYTRKREVEESIILGPNHAPAWMFDREMLWNAVEAAERRKAAQLSREFDIALPIELVAKDPAAAKAALKTWAQDMFVAQGLMVDINFHNMASKNPHAHIMTTRAALERWSQQASGKLAATANKTEAPPRDAGKGQAKESQSVESASSHDDEYERLRKQAKHISEKNGGLGSP